MLNNNLISRDCDGDYEINHVLVLSDIDKMINTYNAIPIFSSIYDEDDDYNDHEYNDGRGNVDLFYKNNMFLCITSWSLCLSDCYNAFTTHNEHFNVINEQNNSIDELLKKHSLDDVIDKPVELFSVVEIIKF